MAFPRLFRIFYSLLYTLLNIILLVLLLITPGDGIVQALSNKQLYNVFVIAGCYLFTLLLAIIIYASRLYTNRTVLAAIPKTWIPVEKGDVGEGVRKMVVESLTRSATIAWNARPRVSVHTNATSTEPNTHGDSVRPPESSQTPSKYFSLLRGKRKVSEKDDEGILVPLHPPVWGEIAHEGWSPPTSPDLPNLQFITVILELPHLIEAKAVSLAPPDPTSSTSPPMPDLRAVQLLQRPVAMGLRDYIAYLTSLGILAPLNSVVVFLSAYETARFSSIPRTEPQFRELMRLFAEVLRSMTALEPAILESLHEAGEWEEESDIDADASSTTTSEASLAPRSRSPSHAPSSKANAGSRSNSQGSHGTIRTAPPRPARKRSPGRDRDAATTRSASRSTGAAALVTAPTTPKNKKHSPSRSHFVDRSPSMNSFSQSRRPYAVSQASSASLRSLSAQSGASGSGGGSVIRLSRNDEVGGLPYVLRLDA